MVYTQTLPCGTFQSLCEYKEFIKTKVKLLEVNSYKEYTCLMDLHLKKHCRGIQN